MDYASNYDIGDRKRDGGINEDSVALSVFEQGHREGASRETDGDTRSVAVFALADGAGGHDAGDVASYLATTTVCEHLAGAAVRTGKSHPETFDVDVPDTVVPDQPDAAELQAAVEEAIVRAHRQILTYARESGTGAYTTVVAGMVVDGQVHYGWVGDSRLYLINEAGERIDLLTTDHGVVEELRRQGEIDDVEAHVHPRGNEITRALGGVGDVDPETATVPVETATVPMYAEDVLLVTSDGLIDAQTDAPQLYERYVENGRSDDAADTVTDAVVTDDEIRDVTLAADSLSAAAEDLIDMGNERGGKDNLSTILARDRTFPETPDPLPARGVQSNPVEDRETVILSDE